jgi:hypothetical protein
MIFRRGRDDSVLLLDYIWCEIKRLYKVQDLPDGPGP